MDRRQRSSVSVLEMFTEDDGSGVARSLTSASVRIRAIHELWQVRTSATTTAIIAFLDMSDSGS